MSSQIILLAREPRRRPWLERVGIWTAALGLVVSAVAVAAPSARAATPATVHVDVFHDADRDGHRDAGETGWSGRYIQFYDATWRAVASVPTGVDGRVAVHLVPGDYHVMYSPSQWSEIEGDWVPTADGILEPVYDLHVPAEGAGLPMGFRPVTWSTSLDAPMSTATAPDGLVVESFNDVLDAHEIVGALDYGARGGEAARTKIRFGFRDYDTSFCSAWASGSPGSYTDFSATCHVSFESWVTSGDRALFHEYGHVWSNYRDTIVQQDGTLSRYLEVRGLTGDARLGTSHAWDVRELVAEDYRQLLGSPTAAAWPQENQELPAAGGVPGLEEFLVSEFSTASPDPERDPEPDADTTAPSVALLSPTQGTTVDTTTSVLVAASDDCAAGTPCTATSALGVTLEVDGVVLGALAWDSSAQRYVGSLDPTGWAPGSHELVAVAVDEAGNVARSAVVTVQVPDGTTKGKGGGKKDGGGEAGSPGGGKGGGKGRS